MAESSIRALIITPFDHRGKVVTLKIAEGLERAGTEDGVCP